MNTNVTNNKAVMNFAKLAPKVALYAALALGGIASSASARAYDLPYGTPAQQNACVANMEASLHGQSILGRRGTPEYYQSWGNMDSNGFTEYDVMVGRCMTKLYHGYLQRHGQPAP